MTASPARSEAGSGPERALEIAQTLVGQMLEPELLRLAAALSRRRSELGLPKGDRSRSTRIVERRAHEDGELVLETRALVRKDGSTKERGPYWYFRFRRDGRQHALYLGKTDDPAAKLEEKRH